MLYAVICLMPPVACLHMMAHNCVAVVRNAERLTNMDPAAVEIIRLRQRDLPVEDFVELAHLTSMDKVCLMTFFRGGLSEPLGSLKPLHDPHWTLEFYINLALKGCVMIASWSDHKLH